jgi:hypothetical protein
MTSVSHSFEVLTTKSGFWMSFNAAVNFACYDKHSKWLDGCCLGEIKRDFVSLALTLQYLAEWEDSERRQRLWNFNGRGRHIAIFDRNSASGALVARQSPICDGAFVK